MAQSYGLVSIAAQIAAGLLFWLLAYWGFAVRGSRAGDLWRFVEAVGLTLLCAAVSVGLMEFLFGVPWVEAALAFGGSAFVTWLPYLAVQARWRGFAVVFVSAVLSGCLLVPVWLGLFRAVVSPDSVPYEYPLLSGVMLYSVQFASLLAAHCLIGGLWRSRGEATRPVSGDRS